MMGQTFGYAWMTTDPSFIHFRDGPVFTKRRLKLGPKQKKNTIGIKSDETASWVKSLDVILNITSRLLTFCCFNEAEIMQCTGQIQTDNFTLGKRDVIIIHKKTVV